MLVDPSRILIDDIKLLEGETYKHNKIFGVVCCICLCLWVHHRVRLCIIQSESSFQHQRLRVADLSH